VQVQKALDLVALAGELAAAGVAVPRGLGTSGYDADGKTDVFTYAADGTRVDLPAKAAAVLAAHNAAQTPAAQQAVQDGADLADLRAQAAAIWTRMGQIESATSPTNAQVIAAVRDEATAIKRIVKALGILVGRPASP
jgi:hypothetical protein